MGSTYDPGVFSGLKFHASLSSFEDGQDTPRAYLECCLETIAARESVVQAWVVLNESGAREQADASTKRWREGRPLSRIDGMPIGIKDLLETLDMPTQMGCEALRGNFPKRDNAAVAALREAGAVILGKTVTAELGGAQPGPTTNPFDATRTPGGSSSGTAAAVGACMVPAAIGTQVGGSIIRPASFCANFALKPTQGAINRGERQATSMSSHGPHAACLEDLWTVAMEIVLRAGGDPGQRPLTGPATLPPMQKPSTIAVLETEGWTLLDAGSRAAFDEVLRQIESQGVQMVRRSACAELERLEQSLVGLREVAGGITGWENHWFLQYLTMQNPGGVSERGRSLLGTAEKLGVRGYQKLLERRACVRHNYTQFAERSSIMIAPASVGPAPEWVSALQESSHAPHPTGDPVFNLASSLLGAPVVTVPLTSVGGMPMGIQLMGQPYEDANVTAAARWLLSAVGRVVV